jgi:hypothetical protein
MFTEPKKAAAMILGGMAKAKAEPSDDREGMRAAAEEILSALEKKDATMLVDALTAFSDQYEMRPHAETELEVEDNEV